MGGDFITEQGILLVPEHPLQVLPALAAEIGLNEAITVQQLHYWTQRSKDDEGWVYNTMGEWQAQFPFWSKATIERTWRALRKKGLVEVRQRGGTDRTNHYRLRYEALPKYKFPSRQSDGMVPSKRRDASHQNDGLSSNNSETTQRTPLPPKGGRPKKKVNRKAVTEDEWVLAEGIVAAFNETAGTSYTAEAHLVPIVGRIRQRPDLDLEAHGRIIVSGFAKPWWTGHPAPAVIYGNAAQFEKAVEETRAPGKPKRDPLREMAERDA